MTDNERLMKAGSVRLAAMVLTSSLIIALAMGCAGDYARKRAETYYLQGQALVNRGETDRAIKKFEKSIYLSEKTGFEAGVAHNLNELAIIHRDRREFEAAHDKLNRALEIYISKEMDIEVSKTLNNIALVYLQERRLNEAVRVFEDLIEWDEKTGNQLGVAISLWRIAPIYEHYLSDTIKAHEARRRALEFFLQPGNEKYLQRLQRRE